MVVLPFIEPADPERNDGQDMKCAVVISSMVVPS